jgi:hypothetical protein
VSHSNPPFCPACAYVDVARVDQQYLQSITPHRMSARKWRRQKGTILYALHAPSPRPTTPLPQTRENCNCESVTIIALHILTLFIDASGAPTDRPLAGSASPQFGRQAATEGDPHGARPPSGWRWRRRRRRFLWRGSRPGNHIRSGAAYPPAGRADAP